MAVDKQIMNRRQGVMINAIDPEILTEAKLSADGFVKNTNYATSTDAGVLKIGVSYGVAVTSSGHLSASTRTAEQYASAPATLLVGKGTLENAILSVLANKLAEALGTTYTDAETGDQWSIRLYKYADGPGFNFDQIV